MFLRSYDFKTKLRGGKFPRGGRIYPRKFAPRGEKFLGNSLPGGQDS